MSFGTKFMHIISCSCSKVRGVTSLAQTLIRWRLNEVMARYHIRPKELAEAMSVSQTTVSNLRKRQMPRLSEQTLNKLCQALNELCQEDYLITPGDLIEYIPNPDSSNSSSSNLT